MMVRILLSAALAVSLCACSDPTDPGDAVVQGRFVATGVAVENNSDAQINYFVVERERAAVILWAPCTRVDCPSIEARSQVEVSYGDIPGWSPESSEVLVYWWHVVVDSEGERQADEVRFHVVTRN